MASWRPPESYWATGKAARKPNLGGSWVRLGRSWRLLGRSGAPGASWGAPGRSWGPFWPPGGHFLKPFGPLFGEPLRNCENLGIRQQYGIF